jgi:hypothetical protein
MQKALASTTAPAYHPRLEMYPERSQGKQMTRMMVSLMFAAALMVATAATSPAKDNEGQGPKNGPPQGKGKCTAACKVDEHTCKAEQHDMLAACLDPCEPLRDAADQACGESEQANPTDLPIEVSPECRAALEALRECRQPCRSAFRSGKSECAIASRGCFVNECGVKPGKGKCVAACAGERVACRQAPREAFATCHETCAPLADALDAACGGTEEGATPVPDAEPSPECVAAEKALRDCLQPCHDAFVAASRQCRDDSRTCLADECDIFRGNPDKPADDPNSPASHTK